MENPIVVFGASHLGRAVKELCEQNGNVVYGFLDDNKELHGKELDNVPVLGSMDDGGFLKLIGKKCEAVIAVDDMALRKNLVKTLNEKRSVQPINAFHLSAQIPLSVHIGHGNIIDRMVVIGTGARVGNHGLFYAGVLIGAETTIGDYVQIGMGSVINPGVIIEDDAFVGSGVTVVSGVTIGKGARVGAGSVVIANVKPGQTVFGNPAAAIE